MKLHALINLYNDRTFLAACLESIVDSVDQIIVADGAYQLYYEEYKLFNRLARWESTDGSLEIINGFKNKPDTILIPPPEDGCWPNQSVKRSRLIDEVPDGDWFLIIDADEMLMGDIREGMEQVYESGCLVASTPIFVPGAHVDRFRREWHPRIFKKQRGMHYRGTHWHLRDQYNRIIEEKYPVFWSDTMVLIHFKPFKSQHRILPHSNYMGRLADMGWLEPFVLARAYYLAEEGQKIQQNIEKGLSKHEDH